MRKLKKDGVKAAADLMNLLEPDHRARLLKNVAERDPELALKIQEQMFTFEDIVRLTDRSVQLLFKAVPIKIWTMALRLASEPVKNRVFANLSKRAREALEEDIVTAGPQKKSDVIAAQEKIAAIARSLAATRE